MAGGNRVEVDIIGNDRASDEIAKVAAALEALRDQTVKVDVEVDKNKFKNAMNGAMDSYNKNDRGKTKAIVGINQTEFSKAVKNAIDGEKNKHKIKAGIELDDSDARKTIDGLRKYANDVERDKIKLNVEVDKDSVKEGISGAFKDAERETVNVNVKVDTDDALGEIAALKAEMNALSDERVKIHVEVDKDHFFESLNGVIGDAEKKAHKAKIGVNRSNIYNELDRAVKGYNEGKSNAGIGRMKIDVDQEHLDGSLNDYISGKDRYATVKIDVDERMATAKIAAIDAMLDSIAHHTIYIDVEYDNDNLERAVARGLDEVDEKRRTVDISVETDDSAFDGAEKKVEKFADGADRRLERLWSENDSRMRQMRNNLDNWKYRPTDNDIIAPVDPKTIDYLRTAEKSTDRIAENVDRLRELKTPRRDLNLENLKDRQKVIEQIQANGLKIVDEKDLKNFNDTLDRLEEITGKNATSSYRIYDNRAAKEDRDALNNTLNGMRRALQQDSKRQERKMGYLGEVKDIAASAPAKIIDNRALKDSSDQLKEIRDTYDDIVQRRNDRLDPFAAQRRRNRIRVPVEPYLDNKALNPKVRSISEAVKKMLDGKLDRRLVVETEVVDDFDSNQWFAQRQALIDALSRDEELVRRRIKVEDVVEHNQDKLDDIVRDRLRRKLPPVRLDQNAVVDVDVLQRFRGEDRMKQMLNDLTRTERVTKIIDVDTIVRGGRNNIDGFMSRLRRQIYDAKAPTREFGDQFRRVRQAIRDTDGDSRNFFSRFTRGISNSTRRIPILGGLFGLMAGMTNMFVTLGQMGKVLTTVGSAMSSMGGAAGVLGRITTVAGGALRVLGPLGAAATAAAAGILILGVAAGVGVIGTAAITGGVYATVAALGALVGISSAVAGAVGAGLIAPFVYFAAQSESVKEAWSGLGDTLKTEMEGISEVVAPSLEGIAEKLQNAFYHIKPEIQGMADGAAAALEGLGNRIPALANSLKTALPQIFQAGTQHLDLFASHLPGVTAAIGELFASLSDPKVITAADSVLGSIPGMITGIGDAIVGASNAYNQIKSFLDSPGLAPFKEGMSSLVESFSNADWSSATQGIQGAMNAFGSFMGDIDPQEVSNMVGSLTDAFSNLTGLAQDINLVGLMGDIAGGLEMVTAAARGLAKISGFEALINGLQKAWDVMGKIPKGLKWLTDGEFREASGAMDNANKSLENLKNSINDDSVQGRGFRNSIDGIKESMGQLGDVELNVAKSFDNAMQGLDTAFKKYENNPAVMGGIFDNMKATVDVVLDVSDPQLKQGLLDLQTAIMVDADNMDIEGLLEAQTAFLEIVPRLDPGAAVNFTEALQKAAKVSVAVDEAGMRAFESAFAKMSNAAWKEFDPSEQFKLGSAMQIYADVMPRLRTDQIESLGKSFEIAADISPSLGKFDKIKMSDFLSESTVSLRAQLESGSLEAAAAQIRGMEATMTVAAELKKSDATLENVGDWFSTMQTYTVDVIPNIKNVDGAIGKLDSLVEITAKVLPELDPGAQGRVIGAMATLFKDLSVPNIKLPEIDAAIDRYRDSVSGEGIQIPTELVPPDDLNLAEGMPEVKIPTSVDPPELPPIANDAKYGPFPVEVETPEIPDVPPKEIVLYPKVDFNDVTPPGGIPVELNPKVKLPENIPSLSNTIKQQINDAVDQGYEVGFSTTRTGQIKIEFIDPNGKSLDGAHGFFGNIPPQDVPVQPAADSLAAFDANFGQAMQPIEAQIIPKFDGAMAFGVIPPMPVQILPQFDGALGFGLIPPMPVQILPQFDGALGYGMIPPMPVQIIPQFDGAMGYGLIPPIPAQIIPQFDGALGFGLIPPIPAQIIPQFDGAAAFGLIPPIPAPIIPQLQEGPMALPPQILPVIPTITGPVQLPPSTMPVIPIITGPVQIPPQQVEVTANPASVPVEVTPPSHQIEVAANPPAIDIPVTPSSHTIEVIIGPYTLPGNTTSTHTIVVETVGGGGGGGRGGRFADFGLMSGFAGEASGLYGAAGATSQFSFSVQNMRRSLLLIANEIERGLRGEYSRLAERATRALGDGLKKNLLKQAPKVEEGLKGVIKPIEKSQSQAEKAGKKFVRETTEIGPGGTWKGTQKFAKEVEEGSEGLAKSTEAGSKKIEQSQKSMDEHLAAYKEKYEKLPKDVKLPEMNFSMSASGGGGGKKGGFSKGADQAAKDIANGTKKVTDAADQAEEEWDGVNRKFEKKTLEIGPGGTWKGSQKFSQQYKDAVKAGIQDTIDWVDDYSTTAHIGPVITADGLVEPGIGAKVSSAIDQISSSLSRLDGAGVAQGIGDLGSAITEGLASAPQAAAQAGNEIISALNQSLTGATGDFSGLAQGVSNALNDARTAAQNVLNNLGIDIQIPPVNIPTEFMPPQIPMIPEIPPEQIETMLTPPPVFPPMPPAPNVVVDVMANVDRVLSDLGAIPPSVETKAETETNAAQAASEIKSLDGMNTSSTHTINVVESGGGSGGGRRGAFAGFGAMAGFSEGLGGLYGAAGAVSSTISISSTLNATMMDIIHRIQSGVIGAWTSFGTQAGEAFQGGLSGVLGGLSENLTKGINFIDGAKKIFENIMKGIGLGLGKSELNNGIAPGIPTISVYENGQLVAFEIAEGIRDGDKWIVRATDELAGQVNDAIFHMPKVVDTNKASNAFKGFKFKIGGLEFDWGGFAGEWKDKLSNSAMRMSAGYLNEYGQWVVYHVNDNRTITNQFDGGLVGDPERQAKQVLDVLGSSPSSSGKLRMMMGSGKGVG